MPQHLNPWRRREALAALAGLACAPTLRATEAPLPVFDAHLHYSHDAWERIPPKEAVALMRQAGLKRAMVSSSSDEGTQKLYAEAPDLVLPVLRSDKLVGVLELAGLSPALLSQRPTLEALLPVLALNLEAALTPPGSSHA